MSETAHAQAIEALREHLVRLGHVLAELTGSAFPPISTYGDRIEEELSRISESVAAQDRVGSP